MVWTVVILRWEFHLLGDIEIGTLSRAIHIDRHEFHVYHREDKLQRYLKKKTKRRQKNECWEGEGGGQPLPVTDLGLSKMVYLGVLGWLWGSAHFEMLFSNLD